MVNKDKKESDAIEKMRAATEAMNQLSSNFFDKTLAYALKRAEIMERKENNESNDEVKSRAARHNYLEDGEMNLMELTSFDENDFSADEINLLKIQEINSKKFLESTTRQLEDDWNNLFKLKPGNARNLLGDMLNTVFDRVNNGTVEITKLTENKMKNKEFEEAIQIAAMNAVTQK